MDKYNRSEEIFYVGKVHQILKGYEKSTEVFNRLLKDEEYLLSAIYNIAQNYIAQDKFSQAEIEVNKILLDNPKIGCVYKMLAEVYEKKGEPQKAKENHQKGVYYNNIPPFSDIEYSESNYELLVLFGTNENQANKKLDKLNTIYKQNDDNFTIDICLMILKLHANHGNGVEERASEILGEIGSPAIEKVNQLFSMNVSTCTITNLADVMAKVKHKDSWELMKQYLPYIANMPMTLIPPSLPEKMVLFNEDEGVKEILIVVKPLLTEKRENDGPMGELTGFGKYVFYIPLKEISKKKLKKISKELNYSKEEFKLLEKKIE